MRSILILIFVSLAAFTGGCGKNCCDNSPSRSASPKKFTNDDALWIHFAGSEKIFADTNLASLKEIRALTETKTFADRTLNKLARAPFDLFQKHFSATNDFSAEIRPMLDDIVHSEFFVELRGTNETPEFVFAIRLDKDRSQFWNTNIATILQTWTGIAPVQDEAGVWTLKKHHAPNLFRFANAGEWTVIGIGQDELPFQNKMLAAIKKTGRPDGGNPDSLLEINGDCARLKPHLNLPAPLANTGFQLSVTGKGDALRTELTLVSPEKFNIALDAWRVPTNTIREPLISFTAMRGTSGYGENLNAAHDYDLKPFPNQFYLWALEQVPFQTYALAACDNASNTLERIGPKIISSLGTNILPHQINNIHWETNHSRIVMSEIPVVTPFLQVQKDAGREFLFAGLFPNKFSKNTLPKELLAQILGTTNLVYYDWEITGVRLPQWQEMLSLAGIFSRNPVPTTAPGQKWLEAIKMKCGNTVTEVTLTRPDELSLVRKSNLGLTGFELVSLTRWLDSKNFPTGGHQIPTHSDPAPKP